MKGHLLMVVFCDHKKSKPTALIRAQYFQTLQGKTTNPNSIKRTVALTFHTSNFLYVLYSIFH
jgi:hypothetical protein